MRAARAGAEWASMSTRRVWISAIRSGSVALSASTMSAVRSESAASTKSISVSVPSWRLLLDAAEAGALGRGDRAALGRKLAADQAKQGRLAGPVAPDEAHTRPARQRGGCAVDQQPFAKPVGQPIDMKHSGLLARHWSCCKVANVGKSGSRLKRPVRSRDWAARPCPRRRPRSPPFNCRFQIRARRCPLWASASGRGPFGVYSTLSIRPSQVARRCFRAVCGYICHAFRMTPR